MLQVARPAYLVTLLKHFDPNTVSQEHRNQLSGCDMEFVHMAVGQNPVPLVLPYFLLEEPTPQHCVDDIEAPPQTPKMCSALFRYTRRCDGFFL